MLKFFLALLLFAALRLFFYWISGEGKPKTKPVEKPEEPEIIEPTVIQEIHNHYNQVNVFSESSSNQAHSDLHRSQ